MSLYKYISILLFFSLLSSTGVSQKSNFKKLSSFSEQKEVSKTSVEQNLRYAEIIFNDSISKAVKLVETNLLLAVEYKYEAQEALGYQILGRFNNSLSNYSVASSNYQKAVDIIKNQNNENWYLEVLQEAALNFEKNSQTEKAISFHKKVVELSTAPINKKSRSSKTVDNSYISFFSQWKIGLLQLNSNQLIESKNSYKILLKKAVFLRNKEYQIRANIGLGKVELVQGNFTESQSFFESAQQMAESIEQDDLANEAYDLLAVLYEKQQNLNKSIAVQQEAYSYNNSRGNVNSALNNSNSISQNFLKQGRTKEAIEIINETKPLLKIKDNSFIEREFANTLSKVYEVEGLEQKAAQAKNEYEILVDSFNYNEQQKKLIEQAKNEFLLNVENKMLLLDKDRELNEQTIELLKKDQVIQNETIKRQQTITTLLIVGLTLIFILGLLLLKNNRQRRNNNKLLVLKSLRTQMNPHFIFNSLNSVNSFIAKKDEKSANKYLAEFSKLMREVLETSQVDFIPLAKEIELLKRYLKLEHFRFNSHFDYTFNVGEDIVLDNYQIPPMLLQPFVENAIWHGLRYKKEKGNLDIKFSQETDYLKVTISDNGIGRKLSMESKTVNQKKMKSTGIKNVENRLDIIKSVFKKELVIDIKDLNSGSDTGTLVELKLY
ncbi:MAG: histidine kinase [Flavobacteriales bacterium]|nr:histidine kinase [Flavobacteriales bacterium]